MVGLQSAHVIDGASASESSHSESPDDAVRSGPDNKVLFILLSFEGPDPYARAGGLASRVSEMAESLAAAKYETHLFFIGDPLLPGYETRQDGCLHLHRWCQWISSYHPSGVYDGEEGKWRDWSSSLPTWLENNLLKERIEAGWRVVVLAEEWQTAESVIRLRSIVEGRGWGSHVSILWNANNTFAFEKIPWAALQNSATVTTVSRYMQVQMARYGVAARVIPNGIARNWLSIPQEVARASFLPLLPGRAVLAKVARWDPDKRWDVTIEAVGHMKSAGMRPLLLARGGLEAYGFDIWNLAVRSGLVIRDVEARDAGPDGLLSAVRAAADADVLVIRRPLAQMERQTLYRGVNAVLANSSIEPFGLVGLEAMASGGIAIVGSTGEDYATPGHDCLSIQSRNPWEIVNQVAVLKSNPALAARIRQAAPETARRYSWPAVIERALLPTLEIIGGREWSEALRH